MYSTQGHLSWFPLVPSDKGIWASPGANSPGPHPATPSTIRSSLPPQKKGLSPGPPYLDLTASLAPKFCLLLTYGVFYLVWTLNHPLIRRVHFKNLELISLNLIKKTFSNTRRFSKVFQPWDVKPPCIVPNHWDVLPVAGYGML